jgi:nucleoside-diphosphate-sugar epimerase
METSVTKRIVFTGGTGTAGRHAVQRLLARAHAILNLDLTPPDLPGVTTPTMHFALGHHAEGASPAAPVRKRSSWSGIDAGDPVEIAHKVVQMRRLGRQVFCTVIRPMTSDRNTPDVRAKCAS